MKTNLQFRDRILAGSHNEPARGNAVPPAAAKPPIDRYSEHHDRSSQKELCQRVRLFLEGSNMPALRHIHVDADGDTVKLSGQVRTYYEKQLAVKLSCRVAGVIRVIDQLDVRGLAPAVSVGRIDAWHREPTLAPRA